MPVCPLSGVYLSTILLLSFTLTACGGTLSPTASPEPGAVRISPIDGMTQVYIPAGEFLMGSTSADIDEVMSECDYCQREWFDDEQPQHAVTLDACWIDQTEVTNAMFAKFVTASGYRTDAEKAGSGYVFNPFSSDWESINGADWRHPQGPASDIDGMDDHPVVQVSWNDAAAYCEWSGGRLPTEAEWEKAARGTDGRRYPWGDLALAGNLLNFADLNLDTSWADDTIDDGYRFTAPVGSYPDGASPYGVLDMAGNVWEFVGDWYVEDYYAISPADNPTGPPAGDFIVIRGGSWSRVPRFARTAARLRFTPGNRDSGLGFRCVH